jgi:integrase
MIRCTGTNRFAKPCPNQVTEAGARCAKCSGPKQQTESIEPERVLEVVPAPFLNLTPADEEWTPAEEIRRRLNIVAGSNVELQRLVEVSARLAANSRATNTKVSYSQHWTTFEKFCATVGLSAMMPVSTEIVAMFLAFLTVFRRVDRTTGERIETGKPLTHSYLRQAVAAISYRHILQRQPDPTIDATITVLLEGYGKTYGTSSRSKDPLRLLQIRQISEMLSQSATRIRDVALVLLGANANISIGPSQIARLKHEHVIEPNSPLEPLVLLIGTRGGPRLTGLEIWPGPEPKNCPVAALRALKRVIEPGRELFANGTEALTEQGIVWIITRLGERTPAAPKITDRRLPRYSTQDLHKLVLTATAGTDMDVRDRAIVLALYWGCFRGDELATTRFHQLRFVEQGIEWTLPKSKTDQLGRGHLRGVPKNQDKMVCPVTVLNDWLDHLERLRQKTIEPGDSVFPSLNAHGKLDKAISRESVSAIVQNAAARAGLKGSFGSHSPRAGFATDALDNGSPREQVQTYGGWRNQKSLDSYYRRTNTWGKTNPATTLGSNTY